MKENRIFEDYINFDYIKKHLKVKLEELEGAIIKLEQNIQDINTNDNMFNEDSQDVEILMEDYNNY